MMKATKTLGLQPIYKLVGALTKHLQGASNQHWLVQPLFIVEAKSTLEVIEVFSGQVWRDATVMNENLQY